MKASSLLKVDTDANEIAEKTAKGDNTKALETDPEIGKESDLGENLIQAEKEPTDTDSGCVIDSDGLEKEVVQGGCSRVEETKDSEKVNYQNMFIALEENHDLVAEINLLPHNP